MNAEVRPRVAVIVGSASDAPQVKGCRQVLERLGVSHETRVLSAHRTPTELMEYLATLPERGCEVIIAGAGMAAHLAGVVAAHTELPVIGVPFASGQLQGVDSLLSTVQMPPGVPVACMGIGSAGGKNAAWFAARVMAAGDSELKGRLREARDADRARVLEASLPALEENS